MSESARQRSAEFLKISDQFKLGVLTTESSHPLTSNLSEIAKREIGAALRLLFEADGDVVRKYREFAESGRAVAIKTAVLRAVQSGGRVFFTGCGSTGRLSIQLASIWRDFWQQQRARGLVGSASSAEYEGRALSVMAGGDFALIKSVEGFEDFAAFGRKQLADLGVTAKDVVFAITEGGETSFVIGTAWKGVEAGAKVYFVYNNPDDILRRHVDRSREIIEEPRIEKLNLTTGPMSITGSTRMQATTIQLCVLLTVMEMVLRHLMKAVGSRAACALDSDKVPAQFLQQLVAMHATLSSPRLLGELARLVELEESVYRSGHKSSYFADGYGIDVLTDTTERSPTYCTPPFRKFDDASAAVSWAYLFLPYQNTGQAWERLLKREPKCVEWSEQEVHEMVGADKVPRTCEILRKITAAELMRFKIGRDGLKYRPIGEGDCAVGILAEAERTSLRSPTGFHRTELEVARKAGAKVGLIYLGRTESQAGIKDFVDAWNPGGPAVLVPVPEADFLLAGVARVGLKMLLNALSTCTMVRLGRVMGNYMVWVVASNLKLIDRATRYIQQLAGLDYPAANQLLFEVVEYVEPRMRADQAYPPVVGVAVMRARHGLGNADAEKKLLAEI